MDYNRARMAQARTSPGRPAMHELRELEAHDDVEAVIIENIFLGAKSLLKGLVKNLPAEVVKEVEVVSAKYSLNTGEVAVLKRGWYSGRSIYFE